MSQNVSVARRAEKPTNRAGRVAVIHREPFTGPVGSPADEAVTVLVFIDIPILSFGDPVGFPDPHRPRRRGSSFAFSSVVCGTPGAWVGSFALGGDTLVSAVDARLAPCLNVVRWIPLPTRYHHRSLPNITTVTAARRISSAVPKSSYAAFTGASTGMRC